MAAFHNKFSTASVGAGGVVLAACPCALALLKGTGELKADSFKQDLNFVFGCFFYRQVKKRQSTTEIQKR